MRPVPQTVLLLLLAALCSLCAVQWWRESTLRETAMAQRADLARLSGERDELAGRMKAADAEILRLTAAQSDLRSNSVSKQVHEEVIRANGSLRESVEKQNAAIKERDESLAKQNAVIQRADENIRKLAAERDDLARRANEVTALYNKLVQDRK